jgi:hypothetical protein
VALFLALARPAAARLAKRLWFNDFGVYRGHDHGRTAAPFLRESAAPSV